MQDETMRLNYTIFQPQSLYSEDLKETSLQDAKHKTNENQCKTISSVWTHSRDIWEVLPVRPILQPQNNTKHTRLS